MVPDPLVWGPLILGETPEFRGVRAGGRPKGTLYYLGTLGKGNFCTFVSALGSYRCGLILLPGKLEHPVLW